MILNNYKSMQTGGSMSPKTEYVPLDLTWKDVGTSIEPMKTEKLPDMDTKGTDIYSNYKLDGLESDKAFMYDKIENLKQKLEQGPGGDYSPDQYRQDLHRLKRLVTVGVSGLKQKEARFRDVTTAASPARSDLAIHGNKAFVQDSDGSYKVVPVDEMLNTRVDGKLRYRPQTVGTALEQRASNKAFHSFGDKGLGEPLEGILRSVKSTKDVNAQIKSAFSGVGYSNVTTEGVKTFMGNKGDDLQEYMNAMISGDTGELAKVKEKNKTNLPNLKHAYNTLLSSVTSSGVGDTLRRNAYGEYMNRFGDQENAPDAADWVGRRVAETLNSSMMTYLKDEGIISEGGPKSGSGSDKEPKKTWNPVVRTLNIDNKIGEKYSPLNVDKSMPDIQLNSTPFSDAHNLFVTQGVHDVNQSVAKNSTIKEFAAGNNLSKNMFLDTVDNVQLDEVGPDGQNGLDRAVLDETSTPKMVHDVLTYIKPNGDMGVAWELIHNVKLQDTIKSTLIAEKAKNPKLTAADSNKITKSTIDRFLASEDAQKQWGAKFKGMKFQYRNIIAYDVIVPLDTEYWWGQERGSADKYRGLEQGTEKTGAINEQKYNEAMLGKDGEGDGGLESGEKLHKLRVYSVAAPDDQIVTYSSQIYKTDDKTATDISRMAASNITQRY